MKKIIFTVLPVLWMALIFMFSAAPADDSSELSLSVGCVIADVFIPEFSDWSDARQEAFIERIDYPVRKCAHASEYAVLGTLLMPAFQSYNKDSRKGDKKRYKKGSYDKGDYNKKSCRKNSMNISINIRKSIYYSVITGVAYAASDEFHQLFVPGRAGRITDVMIDSLGLMMGILFAYILLMLYAGKRSKSGEIA
ncbi:VanZ family protein [Bariatricus sp. SGI.154]|uniref:VanZ family protein n=1 Tax=Bariatricus sp. SGI.154 TaxID=3420549 RepID=UPI003CFDCD0D